MKKIGFITSAEEGLNRDDGLAVPFLKQADYQVAPIVWDEGFPDTSAFDAFIFRSCWNYHRKAPEFSNWIQKLKESNKPVFNPIEIVEWNLHKKYLLDLGKQGVPLPKTVLLSRGQGSLWKQVSQEIPSDLLVIKPAISLNGHDTFRLSRQNESELATTIQKLSENRDVLIQEYLPEIETGGELSFVFFNGVFSHALQKVPKSGEFRIHVEYGGKRLDYQPPAALISQAQAILEKGGKNLLYGRVDVVERQGQLLLIELELLDPMLYLGYSPGAPERFANALMKRLS